jgi:hypothetical protein
MKLGTILSGILFFISFNLAFASNQGVIIVCKGDVEITRDNDTLDGKIGMVMVQGDKIITGGKSHVRLVLANTKMFDIGEKSEVILEKISDTDKSGIISTVVNRKVGSIRSRISKLGDKEYVNVRLNNAVMGVRGTDFVCHGAQCAGISGDVNATGNAEMNTPKKLKPMTMVKINENGTVSEPVAIDLKMLKKLLDHVRIPLRIPMTYDIRASYSSDAPQMPELEIEKDPTDINVMRGGITVRVGQQAILEPNDE